MYAHVRQLSTNKNHNPSEKQTAHF